MSFRSLASILALGLASLASGCFLDGTAFQASGSGGGGAGEPAGGGGEGGATGSTTHAGGSGGNPTTSGSTTGSTTTSDSTTTTSNTTTTTTTTTTTGQQCDFDWDCPDPAPLDGCVQPVCSGGVCETMTSSNGTTCGVALDDCEEAPTCLGGACTPNYKAFGVPTFDLDMQDCQQTVCDGNGGTTTVDDDTQEPNDTECAEKGCSGGAPTNTPKAEAQGCFVGPFKCCAGHCCDEFTCLGCVD